MIGGGVSAAGDLLLEPAQQAFSRTLTGRGFREEARLVLAHFRNDAGLIGAADLARHAMVEPPDSAGFGFWPRRKRKRSDADPAPTGPASAAQRTAPSPASGGRCRGSRVSRMPNPPMKPPTASQPTQTGQPSPKAAASTTSAAKPIPIQPSRAGTPGRRSGGSGSGT